MTGRITFHGIDPTNQSAFVCGFAAAVQDFVDNGDVDFDHGRRQAALWSREEAFWAGFVQGAKHYDIEERAQ